MPLDQPLDENDVTTVICVKVAAKFGARVRQKAKRQGVSVSALMRSLLGEWLEEPARPRFKKKA